MAYLDFEIITAISIPFCFTIMPFIFMNYDHLLCNFFKEDEKKDVSVLITTNKIQYNSLYNQKDLTLINAKAFGYMILIIGLIYYLKVKMNLMSNGVNEFIISNVFLINIFPFITRVGSKKRFQTLENLLIIIGLVLLVHDASIWSIFFVIAIIQIEIELLITYTELKRSFYVAFILMTINHKVIVSLLCYINEADLIHNTRGFLFFFNLAFISLITLLIEAPHIAKIYINTHTTM